ncbi:MAG TPA: CvpA family protein [Prolixibacteraceae bacterium]|nr:CvpA family protein [Prolixibacteraceae bacterium]
MNYIDIILGILLILAAISGYRKGFVEELAGLIALILGIWGAIQLSGVTGQFLADTFNIQSKYLFLIAFFVTFIVIVVLVSIVGAIADKLIKAVMLGFVNNLAGLLLGTIKSALILSVILVVFDKIDEDVHLISKEKKIHSRLYEPVRKFAPSVFPFLNFWEEKEESAAPKS